MTEMMLVEFFVVFLGACIGSFLNVCIVRLPKEQSVVSPGSHCMSCKKPIAWFDNIPMLSYLVLGGKCRYCKTGYSIRYFFIELLTAVTFWAFYKIFGLTALTLAYWVMVSGFIVATFVDFEHRIIPDEVSVGGMCVGMVLSLFIPQLHGLVVQSGHWMIYLQSLGWSALGALAGGGTIYAMTVIGNSFIPRSMRKIDHATKEEFDDAFSPLKKDIIDGLRNNMIRSGYMNENGDILSAYWDVKKAADLQFDPEFAGYKKKVFKTVMMDTTGGGDVKLMAMVGAFLGWKLAVLTFFLAPFFGATYGIVEKIRTKDSAIAYGPFLVLAALASLFYGNKIILFVLNGYTLP
jgi:leader peptidase (prepilin peptidase)/N-methyltransferase